ncbi:hypothetical protein B0H10DRAFT_1782525 [Mycena sp. CBHHK59/15]|nr:hypothetical protein B0H10DRAFT_1782525 [Mycena sp. CBHHK59/15]
MALNILAIGASRNIGYFTAIHLLENGATVTFLLRSPAIFDADTTIQRYFQSGKARLVNGDAASEADTRRAWDKAGVVDAVIFSVGGTPKFHLLKGFVINPHNLVTQCLLNVLCTMPTYSDAPHPRFIAVSSIGLSPASHAALPLALRPVYAMIAAPHRDKVGMERVIAHCAGWAWDLKTDGDPAVDIMGEGWAQRQGLPASGTLKRVLVVRPALLTDGECVADRVKETGKGKSYRVGEGELGGYTISRKDVAHFIADSLTRWDEFENKRVNVAY